MQSVEQTSLNDTSKLIEEISQRAEPIIFKGLANKWSVVQQANTTKAIEYIAQHNSTVPIGMGTVPNAAKGRLFYNEDFSGFNFERKSCSFNEFLTLLTHSAQSTDEPQHYMGSTNVERLLPGFRQNNNVDELNELTPLVSMWISNKTMVAAHQDLPDNLAVCIAGKRRFTLFPPEMIDNLYIGPLDLTPAGQAISLVDHQHPDFIRFPKYKTALQHALVAELSPGDALFLPSLWWHSVESLEPINVLVNYWWQADSDNLGAPMDALMHAIANIKSLPQHQKKALSELFNHYVFAQSDFSHIPENAQGLLNPKDKMAIRKLRTMLLNKLNQ